MTTGPQEPPAPYRLIDVFADGVLLTDTDGVIASANQAFGSLFAVDPETLIGQDLGMFDTGGPHTEAAFRETFAAALTGAPRSVDWTCRRADGETFEAEITVARSPFPKWEFAAIVCRDVSERRAEESALREAYAVLQRAEEVGQLGSWTLELDEAASVVWSDQCYRLFGIAPGTEIDTETFFSCVHPADQDLVRDAVAEALERGGPYSVEHRIVRADDGSVRWVLEQADVESSEGQGESTTRLVGIAQDVTDRHHVEEQLRQAQKVEAVGRLAGGVAHDFNNLLTAVIGNAELALGDLDPDHPVTELVQDILDAGQRAARLTAQLLAFSRQQVLDPQRVDVNDVVAGMDRLLGRLITEEVQLTTVLSDAPLLVRADVGALEQVIVNLALNACDAMPGGGRLVIETSATALGPDYAADHPDVRPGLYVLVAVSDNGLGMDAATLERAIEPFFTTKDTGKGTGLGLATVYGIVRQTGGHLALYSEPGMGTAVKVYLPVLDVTAADDGTGLRPAADDRTDRERLARTVLLVEDDAEVRTTAERMLEQLGHRVRTAESAADAVAVAERAPIDVLLTDVVMPEQSGPELAARLRARHPHLAVVFMSGYTDQTLQAQRIDANGAAFLQKPFTTAALDAAIAAVSP